MAKTYLELVNIVLRDINEIPLTEANFTAPRGLQAFVKEAVNRSLLDITNYNDEWPWITELPSSPGVRSHTNTFNTVANVSEYELPDGIDQIDYDNVLITDLENNTTKKLKFIDYNQITRLSADREQLLPLYVYETPSREYMGLYPKPTGVAKVDYISWKEPELLVNATDTLPFEDRFYTVVISRARYYAWLFRENSQQASIALNEYEDNLRTMFRILVLPQTRRMRTI